ncbi:MULTISPECIES: AMP-binding protein [Rhodococcus]|uniref:AMP-binding protein n=1 Tax=Rhodococcus oxybenzonivorans TaxID=1990687 RepID=A0AAE4UWW4_9NOCA|nr:MULTISPECIES: AMP-binding protein [Rhodococcus]MDV7241607.1 AMP-binding protein [Rhodococcus oxybenzonivorans]MDV7264192.1 AMP-binding protein [Rhodococcus oxybenzonivorans]MDV7273860.1 AMP-binding protein [Rhodococcus oxybenzonivorans]MDV7333888.1 AMP-binding protein [Rhodococcus oxybenzonivorans]MDV7343307.1 AMP-binding protein [Rhodococcus oxybenzonivorans]
MEQRRHEDLLPGATIHACIAESARRHPHKSAIVHLEAPDFMRPTREVTYRELLAAVEASASVFLERAGGAPSVVAVMVPMLPEGLFATWGAQRVGSAVPLNPFLELASLVNILNRTAATVLVTTGEILRERGVDTAAVMASAPTLKDVLLVDGDHSTFNAALTEHCGRNVDVEDDPRRDAMVMPTGGTTGAPKLVRMTQRGQLVIAWNVGALMGSEEDTVIGHGMPNFHCGGSIALALRSVVYGQTLLTLTSGGFRSRDVVEKFWAIVERYRMTSTMATPTTAFAILNATTSPKGPTTLTDFHVGGSTVSTALIRAFHARFGIWLRECWGGTEFHGTITGHPNDGVEPRVGSAGRPLPHSRVRAVVLDTDGRWSRDCEPGEHGELLIGGPTVSRGYLDAQLDVGFFVTGVPGGGVWGRTGDLGTVDGDGFVWVSGRSKDLIIRGGHNIDPRDIEEALGSHSAVEVVAAVGRPDPAKGEMPVAYVQLKEGYVAESAELLQFCRDHVQEKAATPVHVTVLDRLPLTPVGKISKPALRARALKDEVLQVVSSASRAPVACDIALDDTGLRREVTVILAPESASSVDIESLEDKLGAYEFFSRVEVGTFVAT